MDTATGPASRFVDVDGVSIHALDHGGPGPALLCLPGITANAAAFDGLANELGAARRVIAVDFRGRGRSAVPPEGYDVGRHVGDVVAVLGSLGSTDADVLGWSLGAKVALVLAATRPSLVRRLILVDPPLEASAETIATLRRYWERLDRSYGSIAAFLDTMRGSPLLPPMDRYVDAFLRADVREDPDGTVRHRVASWVPLREVEAQDRYRTADHLERVTCPTLILRSTEPMMRDGDAVLTKADAEWMASRILDATLLDIEGTTHFSIMLGRHHGAMAAIRTFLEVAA